MAACPKHGLNHAPYTCAEYDALSRAENRADVNRDAARQAGSGSSCLMVLLTWMLAACAVLVAVALVVLS